ncbi:MAG TPA: pitrilysin family protein [Catalimonadaceae bacterium]|nr:pitrilysin family protein [Catalimonadaceae bacterium]HPI10834.1 pitrilysin family protein [Catalimonadaceae bacterium]
MKHIYGLNTNKYSIFMRTFIQRTAIVLAVFPVLISQAQPKLIEKVTRITPGEVVIPYEKYQLPNGLTILIHEDHSDPIVHVDVTYHVGSAREEIGKSGFAHFFEHMMFQGSDNVADEQHFKIITESGGVLNGSTNRDRTNYFETVPSNQLEKMLWLEADRMGFLLDAVTQKKFEVQRATVKNERGQNYDNRPYGLVQEALAKNLFPYGHPYSWLTIGYVEDLNRVDVKDLKNFFLRWYGPNNAVITVGGDVQPTQVLKLIEKYFGSIPKGPSVSKTILPQPKLESDRYVSITDQYAKIPMLNISMPTSPAYSKDEAALDCLSEILGNGNSSILYQKLVKTQKAIRASAFNMTSELAGTLQFSIMPKPGTPLADIEKEVRAALAEFETRGVTDDDLTKFRQSNEARLVYGLESVSGKVSQLAASQTFTGNANYIKETMKQYTSVTREDVIRVYNQYVKGKPMVVLSVLTKGNESVKAAADNYTPNPAGYKAPMYGYEGLKYDKPYDSFDRRKMPVSGPNPVIKEPVYSVKETDGMKMIYSRSDELPTVAFTIEIKGGRKVEQENLTKAGMTSLFESMMREDNELYSAEAMSVQLDKLGSRIDFSVGEDEFVVKVNCLKKNLAATLDLMEARLMKPKFLPETFDRIRNQALEGLKNKKTRAPIVATEAFHKVVYGNASFQGLSPSGTEATIQSIVLADVEACFKNYIRRPGLQLVVLGDLSQTDAEGILNRLKKLPAAPATFPAFPPLLKLNPEPKTVYLVDVPNAAQTEFRIGFTNNVVYNPTGEYYRWLLANYPLGGAFNSRLNLKLREDKGWTYGARSGINADEHNSTYLFSAGIKAAATDSALVEILADMNKYLAEGIAKEEMTFMKNSIGMSEARKYETGLQKASFLGGILKYNLKQGFVAEQNTLLRDITDEEIITQIKKHLDPSQMFIVLAGDKAKIASGLEKNGFRIVELTPEGDVK